MNTPTRTLSASWTHEEEQELETIFAEELQKEIDNEILHKIFNSHRLEEEGWHELVFDDNKWREISPEWIADNLTGAYNCFGHYWYFEKKEDAVLVLMRWI